MGQRAPTTTSNSWAALLEEELEGGQDEEMEAEDGQEDGAADGGGGDGVDSAVHDHGHDEDDGEGNVDAGDGAGDGAAELELDESELKRTWMALGNAVRLLERDPQSPPCLVAEARARRDAAEGRWRAAKKPHPLSKRLKWAEADLRDAESKERQHRFELQQHLDQAARRTRELEERVAVDAARTQRRRAAVEALYAEGAQRPGWPAGSAARAAATGIATEVAPALLAAIERLAHQDGDTESVRQELQLVAASLNRVEGVLRDATDQRPHDDDGPELFDIGDDAVDDTRGDGGGDQRGTRQTGDAPGLAGRPPRPAAASAPRWTKPAPNGPWKKSGPVLSSASAAEEARRLLQPPASGVVVDAGVGAAGGGGGTPVAGARGADGGAPADGIRWQQQRIDEHIRQQEEEMRARRAQQQQEELQRHQAALQQAAEARAAEEARQREALIASMSPQELARAAELHAQQAAVGSQVFGTQAAGHLASMVRQAHGSGPGEGADEAGARAEVDHLMSLSPEELARWDQDCQGMGGL
jgi:DNA-binding transcriptional MerR regulator